MKEKTAVLKGILPWIGIVVGTAAMAADSPERMILHDGWAIRSTTQVQTGDEEVSSVGFTPENWHPTSVPSTVLNALIHDGVYPDMRIGLNSYRIPDSSDAFNQRHDLAKFSHLPDGRNPWRDPYWYRTEFTLPAAARGRRVWLNFNGLNYRADVWLNGQQVADSQQLVGAYSRYRLDVTEQARPGETNCLAVKIHPVDHPGDPDDQLDVFGRPRDYHKEIMKDVTIAMAAIGYDCMPTVPDRQLGLWQEVFLDFTGPVDIRDPFVVTRLPLPEVSPAKLTVSAEVVNASDEKQSGVLVGRIVETGEEFRTDVELAPGESRKIVFEPEQNKALVIENPHLWWPRNYGEQPLYHLQLQFESGGRLSDVEPVTFGIRQVTREIYERNGAHGLRVMVNGQRIFCRGGYIQPEILFDWDAQRMETEVRYLTGANLNIVYFEDIPNPPEAFLEACDRHGLMFGNCFYGCYWMTPGSGYPEDLELLRRGTIDIIHRYRNHPSLVLYMAMNEGPTREEVYLPWRKEIIERDGTRLFIPSGSFSDSQPDVPPWIAPDLPTGVNDWPPKSYGWVEPEQYFHWVRESPNWMFMLESGSASIPSLASLHKFLPDLDKEPASDAENVPLNAVWAHHGANSYYRPYDEALRRLLGPPRDVVDYCHKSQMLTIDQHRAMYEAANHRMWDITSGFSEWKVNACWPSIQWQIYDWYLRPTASYYAVRKACEPLHVQFTSLDRKVIVVNNHLQPRENLTVIARVYDGNSKLLWEKQAPVDMPANAFREVLDVPEVDVQGPVWFIDLRLTDADGRLLSNNFYWFPREESGDLKALEKLPVAPLITFMRMKSQGDQRVAHVQVINRSDRIALLVHLALIRKSTGEEILPVWWYDNYISLLPGERRDLSACVNAEDLGDDVPQLQINGWNVPGPLTCYIPPSMYPYHAKPGETLVIRGFFYDTFLDGSLVALEVDGKTVDSQWVWVPPGGEGRWFEFRFQISTPGEHQVHIGSWNHSITIESPDESK